MGLLTDEVARTGVSALRHRLPCGDGQEPHQHAKQDQRHQQRKYVGHRVKVEVGVSLPMIFQRQHKGLLRAVWIREAFSPGFIFPLFGAAQSSFST